MADFIFTEDTTTEAVRSTGFQRISLFVGGTFDGATVDFQVHPHPQGKWYSVFTASEEDTELIEFSGYGWRLVVTGSGVSTDIEVYANK